MKPEDYKSRDFTEKVNINIKLLKEEDIIKPAGLSTKTTSEMTNSELKRYLCALVSYEAHKYLTK